MVSNLSFAQEKPTDTNESACIVVLHGLGRTHRSMNIIAKSLKNSGFSIWNESYPSTKKPIEELVDLAIQPALEYCRKIKAQRIHFVTHSLGGILVRFYLQNNNIENLGRIVMISPPNKGTEIVDQLKSYQIFQYLTGPVGQLLGTDDESLPNKLNKIDAEIGIITGNRSSDPWFSWLIAGEDDGKVSVERARLDEMKDFLVVDHGHTFIMRKQQTIDQVLYFLENGTFNHSI